MHRNVRRATHALAALLLAVAGLAVLIGTQSSLAHAGMHAATPAPANTAVTTYKGSATHVGQYANETTLTTSNVNTTSFGRVASYGVDGQVYAQPLYVPGVTTAQGVFNLAFVATEHDSVYAFDADHVATAPIWHTSFLGPNITSVPSSDLYTGAYIDIQPEIGITSTPAIDISTGTLYVSAMTKDNGIWVHRLHALDITTGLDKVTPVAITATVAGTGDGSSSGKLVFDPLTQNQRGALVLLNGVVYVPFAGFADRYPYHGWILGYNASTLAQTTVYINTPNGGGGGIWQAGSGVAVDPTDSSLLVQSGNGLFDLNVAGGLDSGDSLVKLSTTAGLALADYFTPFNQQCLASLDKDLGSGGTLVLPPQTGTTHVNEMIGAGKEGRIYVIDRTALGKYTVIANPCTNQGSTTTDNVVQELPVGTIGTGGVYSTPAYWNGSVYFGSNGDHLNAFSLTAGLLSTAPISQSREVFKFPGTNPVTSSNGTTPGTGIVWVISPPASCPVNDHCNPSGSGALRAYDATNLGIELYSSTQNAARDGLPGFVKFSVPTVANGSVFVGTGNSLEIFGLNPPAVVATPTPTSTPTPTPTPVPGIVPYNNVGTSDDSSMVVGNFDGGGRSYSAQALQAVGIVPGAAIPVNNAQFTWPNVTAGANNNFAAAGQVLPVTPVSGAQTLALLGAAANGAQTATATITYTDTTTQAFPLAFSDWTLNGGSVTPLTTNTVVVRTAYRNTPSGSQPLAADVFYMDVALQPGKTIQSVTLPTLGTLHVFDVKTTASAPVTTPPPPPTAYNNTGTSDDAAPTAANFDGGGASYSAQALQAAGVTPGATVTANGVTFTWPNAASGTPNNYSAAGQVLPVTPVSGARTLALLGAAANGTQSGVATITYTDATTQTFTLAFNDWALGGGGTPILPSNSIAAQMAYRNLPTGKQTLQMYVFYTDVALTAGKTIRSVTLPAVGDLHVFAIGTKAPAPTTLYNNVGTSDDSAPTTANIDGGGASYSAQALQTAGLTPGGTVTVNGVTFTWPSAASGTPNNYNAAGQVLPVTPVAGATTLAFLGAGTNGAQSGTATITYSDGTTQAITLAFSDWTLGGGGAVILPADRVAAQMPYRNTATGKQVLTTYVFYTDVALTAGKTVKSVTLPTLNGLHVFSVGTFAPVPTPPFNNVGTSDDSAPTAANFDGGHRSYSAQALQAAGVTPGATVTANGVNFIWPNVTSGTPNDFAAAGQVLPVTPVAGATTLAFLGAGANGAQSGTVTITYSDGTTQTVTLAFSDWTLGGGHATLLPGTSKAITTGYRNTSTGKQLTTTYVFYTEVTLQAGKTVRSVTLPTLSNLHVFTVGTK